MSISPVIDARHRLQPHDLGRQEQVVTIRNVSRQGLERLAPLLHLREIRDKRLLLDPIQCQELAEITGTTNQADWIGRQVLLVVQSDRDQLRIHLLLPHSSGAKMRLTSMANRMPDTMRTSLLLFMLLCLLFLAAAALNDNSVFWQWLGL